MANEMAKRERNVLAELFPGERVELKLTKDVTTHVRVFPVALSHVKEFGGQLAGVMMRLAERMPKGKPINEQQRIAREALSKQILLEVAMPMVVKDLLGLVARCVKFENADMEFPFEEAPHWVVAPVIQKWLEINFASEDHIRPWKDALSQAQALMPKAMGTTETAPSET